MPNLGVRLVASLLHVRARDARTNNLFLLSLYITKMKYELTLTLRPIYYQYTPQNQFNMANMILFDILSPYEVSLVAELTNEQNIHFHGLIELEDIRSKCNFS